MSEQTPVDSTEAALLEDPSFERLLQFLRDSRSFDFTGYKRPSLMRRVEHRMREIGVESFEDYQDVLQLEPAEFTALFNTILINVTSFFRDSDAWEHLCTDILPQVLEANNGSPLRVWSAGCSAGQEAYTIAMLLHEKLGSSFRERVKIYATDVDEDALNHARQASYTERETRGLPESYRERYFEVINGRYVFTPDLRRSVIFGRNDVTSDAPISRIDILLCRNTLMYFNAETQARVVSRLGFALRQNGVLFLGKAEMLLNHASVFEPIDLKRRFFRPIRGDLAEGAGFGAVVRPGARAIVFDNASRLRSEILLASPTAQIAVAADGRLAMVNHRAHDMLGLSDRDLGRPFQDLEMSYRPIELRSHLAAVTESRAPVWLREVEWRRTGPEAVYVDVHLVPLMASNGEVLGASISLTDVTRLRQLRVEVETANRQLELAYEELQSTNEELRDRTTEITDLNAFMESILGSLEAAVIVLDRDLLVQVWTRQAHELWGLRAQETIGNHLLNLDSGLPTAELHPWLRSVITGQHNAIIGRRMQAVNRRGRPVDLRVTVTALQGDGDLPAGALILMEDVSGSDSSSEASDRVSESSGPDTHRES